MTNRRDVNFIVVDLHCQASSRSSRSRASKHGRVFLKLIRSDWTREYGQTDIHLDNALFLPPIHTHKHSLTHTSIHLHQWQLMATALLLLLVLGRSN